MTRVWRRFGGGGREHTPGSRTRLRGEAGEGGGPQEPGAGGVGLQEHLRGSWDGREKIAFALTQLWWPVERRRG